MPFNPHQKLVLASPHVNANSHVCLPRTKADGHLTFWLDKKPLRLASVFREDFLSSSSFLLAFQEPRLEDWLETFFHLKGKKQFNLRLSILCWKVVMGIGEENGCERCRESYIQCLKFRILREIQCSQLCRQIFFSGLSWKLWYKA